MNITEAKELKPGGVYVLKVGARLTKQELQGLSVKLTDRFKDRDIRFVILDDRADLVEAAGFQDAIDDAVGKALEAPRIAAHTDPAA